jgi:hypothetical protein
MLCCIVHVLSFIHHDRDVPLIETDWKIEGKLPKRSLRIHQLDLVIEWFAPFYSHSGYGDEAIFFVLGLNQLYDDELSFILTSLPSFLILRMPGRLHISQFGDIASDLREQQLAPEVCAALFGC